MQANTAEVFDEDYGPWKFAEAPEEIQQLAIDRYREQYDDFGFVVDDMTEQFKDIMASKAITVGNVYYSGFCSQGDGACFEGSISDLSKFIVENELTSFHAILNMIEQSTDFYLNFSCKHDNGRYYHCGSVDFDYDYPDWRDLIEYERGDLRREMQKAIWNVVDLDKQLDGFYEEAKRIFRDHMNQFYRELEKEYYYLTSEECIRETMAANDYTIDEYGEIIH